MIIHTTLKLHAAHFIQSMLCEGMEVVANSLQDFGSWGRRVRQFASSQAYLAHKDT